MVHKFYFQRKKILENFGDAHSDNIHNKTYPFDDSISKETLSLRQEANIKELSLKEIGSPK